MKKYIVLFTLFAVLASCGSGSKLTKSEHDEHSVQIRTQIQKQIDSVLIYRSDSIFIREKNDTVWIEKWHTKTAYREKIRFDTLRLIDTLRVSTTVTETVEKEVNKITGWQWFQIYAGRIFFVFFLLIFLYFKYLKK
jgi:hypothetical protein